MSKIKILFFTPFAGRTGSEMSLYNLIKYINHDMFDIRLYSMRKGELLKDLTPFIKTYYDKSDGNALLRIYNKIKKKLNCKSDLEKSILHVHYQFRPDIWFLNTMMLEDVVEIANKYNIPFCIYFHELITQYGYVKYDSLKTMIHNARFTIGCSDPVVDNLRIMESSKSLKLFECIDTNAIDASIRKKIKINFNNKNNEIIIGMSGQRIDRKGFDLFIRTAINLKNEPYHFLWLGASKNSGYEFFIDKLIAHHKLHNITIVHPEPNQYYSYFQNIDIFFLSSTEDPFPLVMLEAAYLKKYIVSFSSGGVNQLLKMYPGTIIDEINPDKSAQVLKRVIEKEEYIVKHTFDESLFEYSVNVQVKKFEELLTQYAN